MIRNIFCGYSLNTGTEKGAEVQLTGPALLISFTDRSIRVSPKQQLMTRPIILYYYSPVSDRKYPDTLILNQFVRKFYSNRSRVGIKFADYSAIRKQVLSNLNKNGQPAAATLNSCLLNIFRPEKPKQDIVARSVTLRGRYWVSGSR